MLNFEKLIGQPVYVFSGGDLHTANGHLPLQAILHGHQPDGIWIECEELKLFLLGRKSPFDVPGEKSRWIFFLRFDQIRTVAIQGLAVKPQPRLVDRTAPK